MREHPQRAQGGLGDDVVSVVVEAALRACWLLVRTAWWLAVSAVRHPAAAVVAVLGVLLWRMVSPTLVVALVVAAALGLVVWRMVYPASFGRLVRPRLSQAWRMPAYRLYWPHVASRCGLVVTPRSEERTECEVAKLRRLQVTPAGIERLLVQVPVGLTFDDVAARVEAVGQAFGSRSARVVRARPGRVWIELVRRDVLARVVSPIASSGTDLAGLPVGLADDGGAWRMRLSGTHALIAGATGSGKGSVLWSLMAGLAPALRDGWAQVWAIDPKGGMELGLGRGCFARFEGGDAEAMCDLLEEAVKVKSERAARLADRGQRLHSPTPDDPHLVIVVDELATLTAFAERAVTRRIDQAMGLLLTQGRAVGISVVAAVQDPGKDVVTWRDLFPTRIALRVDNPIQVDMVLGEGARDSGARADEISELMPGVGYVRVEGTRAIRRVRAAYLADDDVVELSDSIPSHAPLGQGEETDEGGKAA
ncbi:FtsK/SpoIIIE domain-containing protein [Janibacter cremeus]|uniref:S-DNA-T family DNA segregation ATPase FtsK/SpoIIIE n=1 Tax=Janibacter cremeus TaxID=1285192 RepID=A0A852VQ63_9MICO|nr:FtsK/SpoIIIE domain-containing protein [Janibacter cremeus]NYF97888.1 S-DNA-T family DNA segregation ATPase FtsK/SpoIIIE [Janibacter cremeus]